MIRTKIALPLMLAAVAGLAACDASEFCNSAQRCQAKTGYDWASGWGSLKLPGFAKAAAAATR